jgi:hypothetical protein
MRAKMLSACIRTKKPRAAVFAGLYACLVLCMSAGCMMWNPKWPDLSNTPLRQDASGRFEEAVRLGHKADSRSSIASAVSAYQAVLDVDPENYQAFVDLAHFHLLMGDGYATTISEKKVFFQKAMAYAEGAMFTNPVFRQSIQQGKPTWEACRVLSVRDSTCQASHGIYDIHRSGLARRSAPLHVGSLLFVNP